MYLLVLVLKLDLKIHMVLQQTPQSQHLMMVLELYFALVLTSTLTVLEQKPDTIHLKNLLVS